MLLKREKANAEKEEDESVEDLLNWQKTQENVAYANPEKNITN